MDLVDGNGSVRLVRNGGVARPDRTATMETMEETMEEEAA